MTTIPLGEWTPDNPQHILSTIHDLSNAIPDTAAYTSVPRFEPVTKPVMENGEVALVTGTYSILAQDGNVHTFCGTDHALYRLEATEWIDVSAEGGYNGDGNKWQFAQYGNYVIATNYNDPIQVFDLSDISMSFEVLSENAPRCRTLAVVNEFLFLGDTVDQYDGARPGRVWWGPIANPRGDWTPSQTTMCDYQDIQHGVSVVRIVGGETAKIFMRYAIVTGTFVGSPLVFQFDVVDPSHGCVGINALAALGESVFFLSHDGFYLVSGTVFQSIGQNKVDKYLLDLVSVSLLTTTQCAIDSRTKTVWWGVPTGKSGRDVDLLDQQLVYHYPSGRWGKVDTPFVSLHGLSTQGYTLDQLDTISKSVDLLPFPLDSIMYKGGVPVIAAFDQQGRLCYGYGVPMDAYIITGDAPYGDNDIRTFIRRVRPLLDGSSREHTMRILGKQVISDADTFSPQTTLTRLGDFACRKSGRYHRIRFDLKGDWYEMSGYSVILDKEGTQ